MTVGPDLYKHSKTMIIDHIPSLSTVAPSVLETDAADSGALPVEEDVDLAPPPPFLPIGPAGPCLSLIGLALTARELFERAADARFRGSIAQPINAAAKAMESELSHRALPVEITLEDGAIDRVSRLRFRGRGSSSDLKRVLATLLRHALPDGGGVAWGKDPDHAQVQASLLQDGSLEITVGSNVILESRELNDIGISSPLRRLADVENSWGPLWVKASPDGTQFRFVIPASHIGRTATAQHENTPSTIERSLNEGFFVPHAFMGAAIRRLVFEICGSPWLIR